MLMYSAILSAHLSLVSLCLLAVTNSKEVKYLLVSISLSGRGFIRLTSLSGICGLTIPRSSDKHLADLQTLRAGPSEDPCSRYNSLLTLSGRLDTMGAPK